MMEMERSPFLPLPEGMVIGQVEITAAQLTVEVISTQPSARCPECGSPSDHVHCQYQRTVHDVPCGGSNVVLRLGVRKFACWTATCPRKVFAERLPDLVQPWARVSNRLLEELKALGLSASAEVSERLAPRLGMQVKAPTLLRYLRTIPSLSDEPVRVLGMDDFAIRRGDCYGTILVNLESGKPLDLLPDRTAEAVLPWLKDHQEIEIVSRDRASAYADAVKRALPHAIQVADRYHLVQNLREHLKRFLDRKRTCLPEHEGIRLKAMYNSELSTKLRYLRERCNGGEHSGCRLFWEIKERGYTRSETLLRYVLGEWRTALPPSPRQGPPRKPLLSPKPRKRRLSSRGAAFLMILPPSKLTKVQQHQVEQMNLNEELRAVYCLSQEFVTMLKERQVEALDGWLKQAKASHVTELGSFVNGIRRDAAAVRAAFSLPWSNGTTEGHVNRLKFLKRQMFGRAHLDLLRVKVLHAV